MTLRALPRLSISTFSRLKPASSVITWPAVKTAKSSKIALKIWNEIYEMP